MSVCLFFLPSLRVNDDAIWQNFSSTKNALHEVRFLKLLNQTYTK